MLTSTLRFYRECTSQYSGSIRCGVFEFPVAVRSVVPKKAEVIFHLSPTRSKLTSVSSFNQSLVTFRRVRIHIISEELEIMLVASSVRDATVLL